MPSARARLALFLTFTAGYFLSYFLRSANAVLAPELVRDLGLRPADLGLMTSAFFAAYAAAQVPVGLALDRWGPRGVATTLLAVGVGGALVFAAGTTWPTLAVGRVLLGVGTGSVLLAGLKAFALWWPPRRYATVSGLYFAAGSLGALAATAPLAWLAAAVGWRSVFVGAAAAVALVAAWIFVRVPRAPERHTRRGDAPAAEDLPAEPAAAGGARALALAAVVLLGAAHTGPVLAFQTLWGGPYLYDGYGVDPATAGRVLLWLSLGVSLGYASSGAFADRWGLRRVTTSAALAFGGAQWVLAALVPGTTPLAVVAAAYGTLGFTGGFCVLALANARVLLGVGRSGGATGLVNGGSIAGVFAIQWAIGGVVQAAGGPVGYRWALLGTGALAVVAALVHAWTSARALREASAATTREPPT